MTGAGSISGTNVTSLTYTLVCTDRMIASTPSGGMVCAKTHTIATEASLNMTFPSGFTLNPTAANWTIATTNLMPGATAWPGIGTATAVTGSTVTFPSGDLTPDTLYCFDFAGTNTLTTGSVGNNQVGSLTLADASLTTLNFSQYALSILVNDQIGVSGVVPPALTFDQAGTIDTFTAPLQADTVTSTSGKDFTIATNANSGWVAWVKSANTGLISSSTGASIGTYGNATDNTPTDLGTLTNQNAYDLNVAIKTDSATQGTGTVSQGSGYGAEYAGGASSGGTLTNTFQPIASGSGVTDGDILTLKEVSRVTSLQAAATDYTDTLTVIAAGRY